LGLKVGTTGEKSDKGFNALSSSKVKKVRDKEEIQKTKKATREGEW